MKSSIYINQDKIQLVVQKSATNYTYETIELNEGTVVNGVILDIEEVAEKLKKLRSKVSKAMLIIDSSNIMLKNIVAPKLDRKKTLNIVKNEFAIEEEDYIYDFTYIAKEKTKNTLLACAVSAEFIEKYITVFKTAQIKIESIDFAINGLIKYAKKTFDFTQGAHLLNILIDNTMLSALFEDGEYKFSNRNRMINEAGSEESYSEVYSKYSAMVQFNKSQKSEHEISESYYIGIDEISVENYTSYVENIDSSVVAKHHESIFKKDDYFYACLAFDRTKDDINLVKVAVKPLVDTEKLAKNMALAGVIIGVIGIVGFQYKQFYDENQDLIKEITQIRAYLDDNKIIEIRQRIQEIEVENAKLTTQIAEYENCVEKVEYNTMFSTDMLDHFFSEIEVQSVTYSSSGRIVSIAATANSQETASNYAERLRLTGYADTLTYTGYTYNLSQNEKIYSFQLTNTWYTAQEEEAIKNAQ